MTAKREPTEFISTQTGDEKVVGLLNDMFKSAARMGASDIHIEDAEDGAIVRMRVDGKLRQTHTLTGPEMRNADTKIRMKAGLSPSDRKPMDGRMFIEVDERMVDVRVSWLPTRNGMSIVGRLLDQANASRTLADIDMTPSVRRVIDETLAEPNGLFLVSGPTGSGKTSTLYAMLTALNSPERKIITVEDPVEYRIPLACQVNVERPKTTAFGNPAEKGTTFGSALRSILRQDPDIILIGEIRDAETARIAIEASLTGHLVLSTVHANDAPATITRLLDLGIEPFPLGAALRCVVAQRLLSRLCRCARPYAADSVASAAFARLGVPLAAGQTLLLPQGCEQCGYSGYKGRVPVLELVRSDSALREAITTKDSEAITRAAQHQAQFVKLATGGALHALAGKTTLDQALRLLPDRAGHCGLDEELEIPHD